jgi:hypothetical protein
LMESRPVLFVWAHAPGYESVAAPRLDGWRAGGKFEGQFFIGAGGGLDAELELGGPRARTDAELELGGPRVRSCLQPTLTWVSGWHIKNSKFEIRNLLVFFFLVGGLCRDDFLL